MTIEQLKAIEAAATQAPWVAWTGRTHEGMTDWGKRLWSGNITTAGDICGSILISPPVYVHDDTVEHGKADIDVAVAARNHLPALLAVAEAAKKAVDAGAVEEIHLSRLRGALAELEAVK